MKAGARSTAELSSAPRGSKGNDWWKDQEQLGFLFERALRPLQEVHRDKKQLDIAGVLRQLDVGIIEKGGTAVSSFVEIQKRAGKVGMKDFGGWVYKMQTLRAKELVALSEAGFTQPVFKHVKQLHPNSVRLGRIYEIADGQIEKPRAQFMGLGGVLENRWGFAAVFYQTEEDEVSSMTIGDLDEKIFDPIGGTVRLSLMDVIRHLDQRKEVDWQSSQFHALTVHLQPAWSWEGRTLKRLMLCVECQRRITNATNRFFAYDEEYPAKNRRGLCVIASFQLEGKPATAELVAIPTEDDVRLSGQITVHQD